MESGKKRVPELRFPEFEGEWEERKLGEVYSFKKGKGIPKSRLSDKGQKCILYGQLYTIYGEVIEKVKSYTDIDKDKLLYSKKNDLLIPSSGETALDMSMVSALLLDNIALGGDINILRARKDVNSGFVSYQLNGARKIDIARISEGSSVVHLYNFNLQKLTVYTPSLLEQQKIGHFFYKIDKKLEIQQQRIEALKEYKKGMMQKIFSQEIRFKDDNGKDYPKWEEKRLGEVAEITTGKLDANAMVSNGKYRFYTCAKEYYKIDKYVFDTEALLISGNGANVGYIHYYSGKFNAYQRTYVLYKFKEEIIYIKYYLDVNLKIRIERTKNAGNTPYITLNTLTNMKINLPSLQEQTKIANFLSSLDKKIQLEEEKLENFKQFKKGLMQKMFI